MVVAFGNGDLFEKVTQKMEEAGVMPLPPISVT